MTQQENDYQRDRALAKMVGYTQVLCSPKFSVLRKTDKIELCEFCIETLSEVKTEQYERWTSEYKEILKALQL